MIFFLVFSTDFISYFVYTYVDAVSIERFVSLEHMSASISFDIHAIIIRISLSFHPACTRKRTTRAATRPIIFAVPLSSSHHICFPSRARTLGCGVGRNSLVPHTHTHIQTSLFLLSRHDEAHQNRSRLCVFFLFLLLYGQ